MKVNPVVNKVMFRCKTHVQKRTLIDLILIPAHILFSKQYDWTAIYINDAQGPFLFCTKYESYYQTNISLEKSLFDSPHYELIFIYNTYIWTNMHI